MLTPTAPLAVAIFLATIALKVRGTPRTGEAGGGFRERRRPTGRTGPVGDLD
jgi:hypothetical protein